MKMMFHIPQHFSSSCKKMLLFVRLPMAELVYLTLFTVLSGAPNTQSACQTPKYRFLEGHIYCIHNIPQYRLSPAEYRQPKLPSSYLLHHLVLTHLSQALKNLPCSGFTSRENHARDLFQSTKKLFPTLFHCEYF
jgi:hypothetical protein